MRPTQFNAAPSDPFANDQPDRQPRVQALCRLIQRVPGPAVLAVCAEDWERQKPKTMREWDNVNKFRGSLQEFCRLLL